MLRALALAETSVDLFSPKIASNCSQAIKHMISVIFLFDAQKLVVVWSVEILLPVLVKIGRLGGEFLASAQVPDLMIVPRDTSVMRDHEVCTYLTHVGSSVRSHLLKKRDKFSGGLFHISEHLRPGCSIVPESTKRREVSEWRGVKNGALDSRDHNTING